MSETAPIVLLDPEPRTATEIFSPAVRQRLDERFRVIERGRQPVSEFLAVHLPTADFLVGQPPLSTSDIAGAKRLRGIINVEGNFLQNMDYAACLTRGIRVGTVSPVFAVPVAELALGLALSLARDIPAAHAAFARNEERYGLDGNANAQTLTGCELGFVGFGDLGRAILEVFRGFHPRVRAYDPWISDTVLRRERIAPASLQEVMSESDVIMVVAAVSDANHHLIDAEQLARMRRGASLLLLSRADVLDFDALRDACRRGAIRAATDVLPQEPLPADDPLRSTPNLLLSAHRAGALHSALLEIGERTLDDLLLMADGLPPQNTRLAQPELVARLRSRPVSRS